MTRVLLNHVPPEVQAQAILELRRRDDAKYKKARTTMAGFWQATKPDMQWGWFNQLVCEVLDQFLDDVVAGKQPRVIIVAPPRHGKSEGASRRFPAYTFGRYPRLNFIATSYAADLATRMNRDVQRVMDEPEYQRIFPDSCLNAKNVATLSGNPLRNSEIFEVVDRKTGKPAGSYRAAGVGQGITGMGFDIGLIDDPVKDAKEANSKIKRDAVWEWYETTFYSRASPLSGIIVIMTRWHEDDLVGRLLQKQLEGGDKWQVIRFPAVAEEDEVHRKEGEPLHKGRYPLERLKAIERVLGSHAWAALYQGRPAPKGGAIFKRDDFNFYKVLPELEAPIISVDCAFKDLQSSDFVAIQVWAKKKGSPHKYLLRRIKERLGFSATVSAIRTLVPLYPNYQAIVIEDKANGPAVVETLGKKLRHVIAQNPDGGKDSRAMAMQPDHEAGNIFIPDPELDATIEVYLGEMCTFPSSTNDDEVDATTQANTWFRLRDTAMATFDYYRELMEAQGVSSASKEPGPKPTGNGGKTLMEAV